MDVFRERMATKFNPEECLNAAVTAVSGGGEFEPLLDQLPVPVYVTDAAGLVTYWNAACIDFAGRVPKRGQDRWCVTWQLYTTAGDRLPHEKCPMATAIKQQQPVRDQVAIAVRPDGSRVAFKPYPTPIFGDDGVLRGAVNMLIDVSDEQSTALVQQAGRCRRLAGATYDRTTCEALTAMADSFERTAVELRRNVA
jgi:PAS domain-containing protein